MSVYVRIDVHRKRSQVAADTGEGTDPLPVIPARAPAPATEPVRHAPRRHWAHPAHALLRPPPQE
jgi:hypothetical protein